MDKKIYIYCIKYKDNVVYIGSTSDVRKRQRRHNKSLKRAKISNYFRLPLYRYLCDKIDVIKLEIIGYTTESNMYTIEEKYIRYCLYNKGITLLNCIWPSINWTYDDGFPLRKKPKGNSINYLDIPYIGNNPIYKEIYEFQINRIDKKIPFDKTY